MRGLRDIRGEGFLTAGLEDVHVHTEACDDATQSALEALADAQKQGLDLVCFTAHVRSSTPISHINDYLKASSEAAEKFPDITVRYSLETKLMNTDGELDLPSDLDLDLLDTLHISDHRFPLNAPLAPEAIQEMRTRQEVSDEDLWVALLEASCKALLAYPGSILAHPLSIIPKVGMEQDTVPDWFCHKLAVALRDSQGVMEINNKWSCPGARLVDAVHQLGVPVLCASDAHQPGETGVDDYFVSIRPQLNKGS